MKRQFFIVFAFVVLVLSTAAQEDNTANEDSNYVKDLLAKATAFSADANKSDSLELVLQKAKLLSEKIKYAKGVHEATDLLATLYFVKGELTHSLSFLLENEASAIAAGDSTLLFILLATELNIYQKIGDNNMFRTVLMRRQFIIDNNGIKGLKDTSYAVISQYNSLAKYYALKQINKPDSTEYYYRKINSIGRNTEMANLWEQLSNGGIGRVFFKKEKYDSAIHYLRIATAAALKGNRIDNYYGYTFTMADAFRKSGQLDSAFKYSYSTYNGARQYAYPSLLGSSSGLLAKLFIQKNKYDSAVKYMTLERDYRDSVTGTEALNSIQFLTNDYQLKGLEKQREKEEAIKQYKATLKNYFFAGGVLLLLFVIGLMYRVNKQRTKSKKQIETAYNDLKATQAQLIQSEKMASLGELTAGIAHEIQNPLNFVNNFSEVSNELIDEMNDELNKGDIEEAKFIAADIKQNLEKINHHGKRADAIVKGMLQHSQSSNGKKEPTDINKLVDEYLRLAYHGLRAKDKSFNVTLKTDYDESIGNINIIPQDIGRVLLNLYNNAFYAAPLPPPEKNGIDSGGSLDPAHKHEPTVWIRTKRIGTPLGDGGVFISVRDNGPGIPANIIDKIFQPFFTTKPTGQGTGLGLSLSYDIVTKGHGGELTVKTAENKGSEFTISLPIY